MATAVGLRSVFFKHWTGSLLELDSTGYEINGDNHYFTDSEERNEQCWKRVLPDTSKMAWASRSKAFCSLAQSDSENSHSFDRISSNASSWSETDSNSQPNSQISIAPLSFEQLFGLSQLLKFIHGRSPSHISDRQREINTDIDYKDFYPRRGKTVSRWKGALSSLAMSNNQTSSLTNLPNSVSAHPNLPLDLPDPISLILNRPKRRHYNSESELFLPECAQCNPVTDFQRLTPKDQEERVEGSLEFSDDRLTELNSIPSEQDQNSDHNYPTTEDFHSCLAINRIDDNPDEIVIPLMSDSESQICTVINDSNLLDTNYQTIENEDQAMITNELSNCQSITTEFVIQPTESECTKNDEIDAMTNRSSKTSLKISKSVSFADEIGQCLTETFIFDDDDDDNGDVDTHGQKITVPEYEDFFEDPIFEPCLKLKVLKSNNQHRFTRSRIKRPTLDPFFDTQTQQYKSPEQVSPTSESIQKQTINLEPQPMWNLTFPQPASQYYEFRHRLDNNSVSLESISLVQPDGNGDNKHLKISGTIKVKNISFEKQVWIRVSTDDWKSHMDYTANYSPELSAGSWSSPSRFDTFVFHCTLDLSKITILRDQKIEFAIRYVAGYNGQLGEFWDSNNGRNYAIQLKMVRPIWTDVVNSSSSNTKTTEYATNQHYTLNPYTLDYRPNFDGFSSFTDYRAWRHFAGETSYY